MRFALIDKALLRLLTTGGRTPAPGTPAARRLALAYYAYGEGLPWVFCCVATTLHVFGLASQYLVPLLIFSLTHCIGLGTRAGIDAAGKTTATLLFPVDRATSYSDRFRPGFLFIVTFAVLNAAILMTHDGLNEKSLHLALLCIWPPLIFFTAGFACPDDITRKTKPVIIIVTGGLSLLILGAFVTLFAHAVVQLTLHAATPALLGIALYRWGNKRFLTVQVTEGAVAPDMVTAECVLAPPTPSVRTRPTTVTGRANAPLTAMRTSTAAAPRATMPLTDADRRRALLTLAYGGTRTRSQVIIGLWFASLLLVPAALQTLLHLLFAVLWQNAVADKRWRITGSTDFAHLLPATRRELLLLRSLPVFLISLGMVAIGYLISPVLHIPESIFWKSYESGTAWDALPCAVPLFVLALTQLTWLWPKQVNAAANIYVVLAAITPGIVKHFAPGVSFLSVLLAAPLLLSIVGPLVAWRACRDNEVQSPTP